MSAKQIPVCPKCQKPMVKKLSTGELVCYGCRAQGVTGRNRG